MKELVVFETSKGTIEIELHRDKAPVSVENFVAYVESGHYTDTVFHRVIDGFMIQGGGFTADMKQKPAGKPIKLESANGLKNRIGTIAMARTNDPDSATCQFFINVRDNGSLDRAPGNDGYAVFGTVTAGMDVVNAIRDVRTKSRGMYGDWPVEDVVITSAAMKQEA